ncbi:MAG: LysM peptidoglycan-binding domain-containing protein, partial [Alphaproteobacteria bacterium]|nr:LysM peptidoglycan-binding domain-containing protein [Alphaproteobacteria bacterium]
MMHPATIRTLTLIAVPVVLAACARFDHFLILEPRGPAASTTTGAATMPQAPGTWRVGPGETLSQIAQRTGVPLASLAQANGIEPPFLIRAGQVLRIPGGGRDDAGRGEPVAAETARATIDR